MVFPMRVGMVRGVTGTTVPVPSFPHACGDGPKLPGAIDAPHLFSPCVWGWSVFSQYQQVHHKVFPMRVGMVRCDALNAVILCSFPHACGDGPGTARQGMAGVAFSPCVWGWSEEETLATIPDGVFPMRVGMVRHSFR